MLSSEIRFLILFWILEKSLHQSDCNGFFMLSRMSIKIYCIMDFKNG